MRLPFMPYLMKWGIQLTVPRQRIGVAVVAVDDDNRVLMLRHVFHPSAPWGLPGGWLKRNEAPEAGALREMREETGLTAVLEAPVRVEYDTNPPHIAIAYLARVQAGSLTLSPEILEAAWFPANALPSPLFDFVRRAIETAVATKNREQHSLTEESQSL